MGGQPLEHNAETDLVSYRRGVSLREIAKGALVRFLPGSLISLGGLTMVFDLSMRGDAVATVGALLGFAGALTLGFALALLGLRRWLYPDARLGGQRSFLAGLLAPLALFVAATTGLGMTQLPVLLVVVGVITALGMFFAWLTPAPEAMRGDGFEPDSLDPIAELSGRAM